MEATGHPLGNWRLQRLPIAYIRLSDGQGGYHTGVNPALLHLPYQCSHLLFQHVEVLDRWRFPPLN